MDRAGLSAHDFKLARAALLEPHEREIELHVLDLADGRHLRTLTPKVLDGQVTYDTTADVSRTLSITFLDQNYNLGFEPDDPSDAPLHRSRELRVHDRRFIAALNDWVEWAVFTGPCYDFTRDGGEVSITAHGRDRQALGNVWQNFTFRKKSKITDAIRKLLAAVGDTGANVPDLHYTLPETLAVHHMDTAWVHIEHLAASIDYHVFYDGRGRFQMRPHGSRPVYRFHRALLGPVRVQRTVDGVINTVRVFGHNPKGPKQRPVGLAVAKGPLSPGSLARNDVPLHLVYQVERDHAKTNKQVQKIADRLLREKSQTRTDVSWDSIPLPFLEERDMVAVTDDSFGSAHMRLRQWVLPLSGGEPGGADGPPMTVGSVRRTTKARLRR